MTHQERVRQEIMSLPCSQLYTRERAASIAAKAIGELEEKNASLTRELESVRAERDAQIKRADFAEDLLDKLDEAACKLNPPSHRPNCWEMIADLPGDFAKLRAERDGLEGRLVSVKGRCAHAEELLEKTLAQLTALRTAAEGARMFLQKLHAEQGYDSSICEHCRAIEQLTREGA